MSCYLFKPKRRAGGVVQESHHWFGALRLPWEPKERRWCLNTADRREAERLLHEERINAEKRHHGILPPQEHADAASRPLEELLEAFLADLQGSGAAASSVKTYRNLLVLFGRVGWRRIADVTPRSFCEWRARSKLAPRTLNALLKNTWTFFRWMKRQRMVLENPLDVVRCVDTRRIENYRRAFLPEEMQRMISGAPHERAVVYLVAVNTGLRRNEMQQLTMADLELNSPAPFLRVRAAIAKHPKTSLIRLVPDVVAAIRSILPELVVPQYRVFAGIIPRVPTFKKDLARAEIPFRDEFGRRLDFHSLRQTFGTNLAAAGVDPFTLKELMRHSTVQQTEKYYIDARRLPTNDAVAKLPKFGLRPAKSEPLPVTAVS